MGLKFEMTFPLQGSMILTLNTALLRSNDEEVNQDLSFEVLEKAENATKIDASIEAAEVLKDYKTVSTQIDGVIEPAEVPKDDNKLSIFTGLKDETETSDWTEFGDDDYVSILTELLTLLIYVQFNKSQNKD